MKFSGFSVFSQQIVSPLWPGYILFLIFFSCNDRMQTPTEIKIAKTVPPNYVNANDSGFTIHQDTVYCRGKYFTGYRFSLYPAGDTEFVKSYFNGVEEGFQKQWYPNKQVADERFYINGKKEGMQRGWWPGGKPKFQFHCNNDEYEGEFMEWYPSGLLGKAFHYEKGKEVGSQRLWWDNGSVRANYVVKKGRKYGLIGLKICENPYDSVIKK